MTEQQEQNQDDLETGTPSPNAEAARYRTQLRATEAERDQLRERVAQLQRGQVEAILAEPIEVVGSSDRVRLHNPADLWAGTTLEDLLVDGEVSAEAVRDLVRSLHDERPYLLATVPVEPPRDPVAEALARQRGASPGDPGGDSGAAWAAALSPQTRR